MSGGPCDAAAKRAGGEARGEGSLHPFAPTESTSHSARVAGGKAREEERERARERDGERGEREEGGRGESVCVRVSSVCARGLHHRIPFTVSAGGHALMERIKKLTTLSFPSDLSTAVAFQM